MENKVIAKEYVYKKLYSQRFNKSSNRRTRKKDARR